MIFTWDTTNLCIVFPQWHIRGTASLIISLLAVVAICAGYEAMREATRRFEAWTEKQDEAAGPSESLRPSPPSPSPHSVPAPASPHIPPSLYPVWSVASACLRIAIAESFS